MCDLEDKGFIRSKYTWWSGRRDEDCIFKRLDRVLLNDMIQSIFPLIEVEHLIRSGSDHALLQISFSIANENVTKSFKF